MGLSTAVADTVVVIVADNESATRRSEVKHCFTDMPRDLLARCFRSQVTVFFVSSRISQNTTTTLAEACRFFYMFQILFLFVAKHISLYRQLCANLMSV